MEAALDNRLNSLLDVALTQEKLGFCTLVLFILYATYLCVKHVLLREDSRCMVNRDADGNVDVDVSLHPSPKTHDVVPDEDS